MTGIILAGGKNSRIGTKKAFLNIGGGTIIENTLSKYKKIFKEVIIVSNTTEDYSQLDARIVRDIIPQRGPLGGLYTGLMMSKYNKCFVSACDMPFVNESLIHYITGFDGYDLVVPVIKGKYEPLFALYTKNCLKVLEGQLKEGNLKLIDAFSKLGRKEINLEELLGSEEKMISLFNINTTEDYNFALSLSEKSLLAR